MPGPRCSSWGNDRGLLLIIENVDGWNYVQVLNLTHVPRRRWMRIGISKWIANKHMGWVSKNGKFRKQWSVTR